MKPISERYLLLPTDFPYLATSDTSEGALTLSQRKNFLASFLEEVWSLGDVDACERYVAPCYAIRHDPGDPWNGQVLNREALKDRVRQSRAPFPDQRFHVQALLEDEGRVAVAWTWTATHAGDISGFPATGRSLEMSGLTIYDFDDDGLISGHWQVSDRFGIFQQLQRGIK